MTEKLRSTVGNRSHHTERRVTGPCPHGGEWDHGWRRESADKARAHAVSMTDPAVHPDVPWARVQTRIVETEVTEEEIVVPSRPPTQAELASIIGRNGPRPGDDSPPALAWRQLHGGG